ncbi:hypothetical protein ASE85_17890 [Sphingobium sp. Leaf26]|uniref:hypothetical protein n=1 Tax=Sphingobium sp. Leaf26 TaxID=1735693 RepID=UPI0006F84BAA|nr:hypothetical protein [Sphingobium sp. Leaf26]KQN07475.1 hypothetical protein ASE85_17890 [Sphingobium sp. Leaf26]
MMIFSLRSLSLLFALSPLPSLAAEPDFFGAALCQPPYSLGSATALYEAAEKIAKPDTSALGAAIYHLRRPIERDGFVTQDVMFGGMAVGVLIQGEVAGKLAERFDLKPESHRLLGSASLGFSRQLPDADQGMKDMGLISIVARQGPALKGQTLLACEFVSDEDRATMEELEGATPD